MGKQSNCENLKKEPPLIDKSTMFYCNGKIIKNPLPASMVDSQDKEGHSHFKWRVRQQTW